MKWDDIELGRQALARLRRTATDARRIQEETLLGQIRRSRDTDYGKRYGFSKIRSVRDYQRQVPLSDYRDYSFAIERMLAGGAGLLSQDAPLYYSLSSGSTGEPKYVPVSEQDVYGQYLYVYGGIFGMLDEYFDGQLYQKLSGKIFQTGEFSKTFVGNTMSGVISSAHYRWMERNGRFDSGGYTAPMEVLFPEGFCDLTYVKVRLALAARDVCAIHGVYSTRLVRILRYLENNWEMFLQDIETGSVDARAGLPEEWQKKLRAWLPADPKRAAELRSLHIETDSSGMIPRIWPRTAYMICIGGSVFPSYTKMLDHYRGGVPVVHSAYGASEGIFGISNGVDRPDAYILIPEIGFFEFIPEGGGEALTIADVEIGKRYELIFTNLSGLYRYQMQDIIEIVDFYGQTPVVKICYRKNQLLSLMDEKTSGEHLELAMNYLEKDTGVRVQDFCVREDAGQEPGNYVLYLEKQPGLPADLARRIDDCLCRASFSYRGVRELNELAPLKVRFVRPGSFAAYEEYMIEKGRDPGQRKPVRILAAGSDIQFFEGRITAT